MTWEYGRMGTNQRPIGRTGWAALRIGPLHLFVRIDGDIYDSKVEWQLGPFTLEYRW